MEEPKASEDRVIMLSDGVFAIAITLLVLDIRLPDGLAHQAFNDMMFNDFLPKSMFYVVTFLIIARYWFSHRSISKETVRVDSIYLQLNILFLAFIAFIPAVSNLIEEYNYTWSVILYTVVLAGCGYAITALWAYALKKPLIISHDTNKRPADSLIFHSLLIPTYFLCSLFLLFIPGINPSHVFFSWLAIPVILFVINRIHVKVPTMPEKSNQDVAK